MTERFLNVRVWDKEKREMAFIQWHMSHVFFKDENDPYGADKIPLQFVMSVVNSDRFVKLLSTTQYDKNKREMFEGDIVRRDYGWGHFDENNEWIHEDRSCTGYFKWEDCGFVIEGIEDDAYFYTVDGQVWFNDELTIIGNIYENPELLEGKSGD